MIRPDPCSRDMFVPSWFFRTKAIQSHKKNKRNIHVLELRQWIAYLSQLLCALVAWRFDTGLYASGSLWLISAAQTELLRFVPAGEAEALRSLMGWVLEVLSILAVTHDTTHDIHDAAEFD